jgi:hypothetical protein
VALGPSRPQSSTPISGLLVSSEGTRHDGLAPVGSRELLRSFLRSWEDPVSVQGNIIFPHPTRYRLFQWGSTCHVTSRHHDVSDTESTDITEVLPVGYQVTSLLEGLLWISVGQDSHLPIQTVLHVIRIPDFSTSHRLDTYTPTTLLRPTGFMGSPSSTDSQFRYWKPTLIPTSDLPL